MDDELLLRRFFFFFFGDHDELPYPLLLMWQRDEVLRGAAVFLLMETPIKRRDKSTFFIVTYGAITVIVLLGYGSVILLLKAGLKLFCASPVIRYTSIGPAVVLFSMRASIYIYFFISTSTLSLNCTVAPLVAPPLRSLVCARKSAEEQTENS